MIRSQLHESYIVWWAGANSIHTFTVDSTILAHNAQHRLHMYWNINLSQGGNNLQRPFSKLSIAAKLALNPLKNHII